MANTKYNYLYSEALFDPLKRETQIIKEALPDNYLYISHLDGEPVNGKFTGLGAPVYWILPCYPDAMSDSMNSNFTPTNALGRSAPVQTYNNSGPREVQIDIALHRDLMDDLNFGVSNAEVHLGEDYVDSLIRAVQAIAVPKYNISDKAIEPPLVAVRLANEVFIKGIVTGSVGVTYEKPILSNNRYAMAKLSFKITEVDPYDSSAVYKNGTFRGVVGTLREGMGLA